MNAVNLSGQERIEVVDTIRGFALLGIILANLPGSLNGDEKLLRFLYYLLIDNKFIPVFSILFGFGLYKQMERARINGYDFNNYIITRLALLFIIGSLHAFIIWNGDILRSYALGGLMLVIVKNWPVKRLIAVSIIFSVLLTGGIYIANSAFGWRGYNYDYALAKELMVTGSLIRYLTINAIMDPWVNFFKDMPITLFFTFGNMLFGLALAKINFFQEVKLQKRFTRPFLVFGVVFSLACSFLYYKVSIDEIQLDISLIWLPFVILIGTIAQSFIYILSFLNLYQFQAFHKLLSVFRSVGRTALSNYILQSVFYLVVFYHFTHAFQLFGKISMSITYLLGLGFFIFQLFLSYWWLKRHRQGPIEYLWKKLSYQVSIKFN